MCQQQVDARRRLGELLAERTQPGAGVEDSTPSPVCNSTQEVLPPYRTVSRAGRGERAPAAPDRQAHRNTYSSQKMQTRPLGLVVLGQERKRSHRDGARDAVETDDAVCPVHRPALEEGRTRRHLVERHRLAVQRRGFEGLGPLLRRKLARLGKRAPEDALRRLVVEDEVAFRVRHEHRHGELGRKLPRQDQDETFLTPYRHGHRSLSRRPRPSLVRCGVHALLLLAGLPEDRDDAADLFRSGHQRERRHLDRMPDAVEPA